MAAIGFLGALGCLFVYFFLNRIIYVMVILPIFPVVGIITAIKTIISDKGIPKAYIGLILSILGILPSILCTIVFFLDIYFGLFVK